MQSLVRDPKLFSGGITASVRLGILEFIRTRLLAVVLAVATPGLLASVLLSLGHSLLGGYIAHGGLRTAYGAAGSVMALVFSFYFLAYVVLLGAQFGKVHDELRQRVTGPSAPR